MQITVGTQAVRLPVGIEKIVSLVNLGPGKIYIDFTIGVTAANGFQLGVGDAYETPMALDQFGGGLYLVADADATDVRYLAG